MSSHHRAKNKSIRTTLEKIWESDEECELSDKIEETEPLEQEFDDISLSKNLINYKPNFITKETGYGDTSKTLRYGSGYSSSSKTQYTKPIYGKRIKKLNFDFINESLPTKYNNRKKTAQDMKSTTLENFYQNSNECSYRNFQTEVVNTKRSIYSGKSMTLFNSKISSSERRLLKKKKFHQRKKTHSGSYNLLGISRKKRKRKKKINYAVENSKMIYRKIMDIYEEKLKGVIKANQAIEDMLEEKIGSLKGLRVKFNMLKREKRGVMNQIKENETFIKNSIGRIDELENDEKLKEDKMAYFVNIDEIRKSKGNIDKTKFKGKKLRRKLSNKKSMSSGSSSMINLTVANKKLIAEYESLTKLDKVKKIQERKIDNIEEKVFQHKIEYNKVQKELYFLVKNILMQKKEYVRVRGICHFLNTLKNNGIQFTYEILPRVWTFDEWKFILDYTSKLHIKAALLHQLKKEKAKKFIVKGSSHDEYEKLNILKNQLFKSKSKNHLRSRTHVALRAKEEFDYMFRKRKKSAPQFGNERKKQKEIDENDLQMKKVVFDFLKKRKIEEKIILEFRNDNSIPFRLDTIIGFSRARYYFELFIVHLSKQEFFLSRLRKTNPYFMIDIPKNSQKSSKNSRN